MSTRPRTPRVTVVTPFYNTAEYLGACIDSVLSQSFDDFEYLLADNRSNDGSREVAESHAARDPRIRLLHFDEHLPQLENYNRALSHVGPGAEYVKIVQADDLLMPRCLEEMVQRADSDEGIGMVGAYTLLQDHVFLDGLDFREEILDGRDAGRRYFFGGPYLFGTPSTSLFRAGVVRAHREFFPTDTRIGDACAALRTLADARFGFVHQVLSVSRVRTGSISADWGRMGIDTLTRRVMLERYGERFLSPTELERTRRVFRRRHYRVLAEGWLTRRPQAFWDMHRNELAVVGLSIERGPLLLWAVAVAGRMLLSPEWFFRPGWPWNR